MSEGVESYNKDSLTIVVPNESISSSNYNFKKAFYKGCICMYEFPKSR